VFWAIAFYLSPVSRGSKMGIKKDCPQGAAFTKKFQNTF